MTKEMFLLSFEKEGKRVLGRIFTTEQELQEYVRTLVHVKIKQDSGILVYLPYQYRVDKYELDIEAEVEKDSGIQTHMTVQGLTGTYGIALDKNGEPLGCTCPDFEYRGGYCKHMRDL